VNAIETSVTANNLTVSGGESFDTTLNTLGVRLEESIASINWSTFKDLTSYSSPAIYAIQSSDTALELYINSTTFEGLTSSTLGGAVQTTNMEVKIEKTKFINNQAAGTDGGALYLNCEEHLACPTAISETNFKGNSANRNGGAVFYNSRPPEWVNNVFEDNSAKFGNHMATAP